MGRAAPSNSAISQSRSIAEFAKLAESGGDLSTSLADVDGLPAELAKGLRQTYVASYAMAEGGGRRAREVRVILKDKDLGRILGGVRVVVR